MQTLHLCSFSQLEEEESEDKFEINISITNPEKVGKINK